MIPRFSRMPNGDLRMGDSKEAHKGVARGGGGLCQPPEKVHKQAVEDVRKIRGDPSNKQHVQGMSIIQFGRYRGQTFKWMLENCLGYAGWLVDDMRKEAMTQAPLSVNKHTFKEYTLSFPEGVEAVEVKRKQREQRTNPPATVKPSDSKAMMSPAMLHKLLPPGEARRRHREQTSKLRQVTPTIPSPKKSPTKLEELSDETLALEVEKIESASSVIKGHPHESRKKDEVPTSSQTSKESPTGIISRQEKRLPVSTSSSEILTPPSKGALTLAPPRKGAPTLVPPRSETVRRKPQQEIVLTGPRPSEAPEGVCQPPVDISSALQPAGPANPIIESWKSSLPAVDIPWISRALFSLNARGKPELDDRKIDRLWYYPPQPQLIPSQRPRLDRYFGHRLLLWMPQRIWKMKLLCPHCKAKELTRQGPYRLTRMVLDVDGFYILAAEYLHCSKCNKNQISWSNSILSQLDPGTRSKFPVQILYKTACDNRVIYLLHQRGLGNSPTQLQKKILELHNTAWTTKQVQYLTDCKLYGQASKNRLIAPSSFDEPPEQIHVPTYQWFIAVYCQEVKQRLEEVKAAITSVYGRILKMDSTKKVTKKLAGEAARTAAWATSISNENGQVLQCVLTAGEGTGVEKMALGIVKRYSNANVQPPLLMYVDSHCCGQFKLMDVFLDTWPDMVVRLDVWHYMRRLSVGVTTDTHRLYATFMSQLSHAIFEWDKSDLDLLKKAKRCEMIQAHIQDPTEGDVIERITRKEMALHCRRRTRGTEETISMIQLLLEMFDSDQGRDTMGVPLLHHDRIWEIWRVQRNHVQCLQDPEGIPLYTQTGTLKKGGVQLPVYRCARGSTSLESFHLHLQRFIPGTSANANNFQAYLLEGLMRWNEDRALAATSSEAGPNIYSASLKHSANRLAEEVMGRKIFPNYQDPKKYTGELIGIEYLFDQTGKTLTEDSSTCEEEEAASADTLMADEGFEEGEELFDDPTLSVVDSFLPTQKSKAQNEARAVMEGNRPSRNFVQLPPEEPIPTMELSERVLRSLKTAATTVTGTVSAVETATTVAAMGPETVTMVTETAAANSSALSAEMTSSEEESVGPGNVGGFDRVMALAEYLFKLLDKENKVISNAEADNIITLWSNMQQYDKSPTKFKDRFQPQLVKGRFKSPKSSRTQLIPGVQSVKRCSLAPHLGPAAWPDSNRYQEALISKLCLAFPSSTSKDGKRQARWNLVISSYNSIREMIFNNQKVMRDTNIQLPDINQRTLTAWFSARGKRRERDTLEQGLKLHLAPSQAHEPLTAPLQKPSSLESGSAEPFQFIIPENTTGQKTKGRRRILPEQPPVVCAIAKTPISILPQPILTILPGVILD